MPLLSSTLVSSSPSDLGQKDLCCLVPKVWLYLRVCGWYRNSAPSWSFLPEGECGLQMKLYQRQSFETTSRLRIFVQTPTVLWIRLDPTCRKRFVASQNPVIWLLRLFTAGNHRG
jgi:hypothetical protein